MSNEKHYDYYKTSAATRIKLEAEFKANISNKRNDILDELMKSTGCIAWRERSGFGHADFICELVYPAEHKIQLEKHIKVVTKTSL